MTLPGCWLATATADTMEETNRAGSTVNAPAPSPRVEVSMPAKRTCYVDGCDRPRKAYGLCYLHDRRMKRFGSFDLPVKTVEERFWEKVDKTGDCWEWTAYKHLGYGKFMVRAGKCVRAHRLAYEWLVGPIPDGLVLDHLCRNTGCVNPDHLEPVTDAENTRRGNAGKHHRDKTHCPQGHPYDEENTYISPPTGDRLCRECRRLRNAEVIRRKKAMRNV